jgi:hypothetical protein
MGIEDRLRRLEGDDAPLCEERPCTRQVWMYHTRVLHPDGMEYLLREASEELPPPCGACPYGEGGGPVAVSRVEVVRTVRAGA